MLTASLDTRHDSLHLLNIYLIWLILSLYEKLYLIYYEVILMRKQTVGFKDIWKG